MPSDFENILDIQRNMASRLASETRMDKTVELLAIVQNMVTDKDGKVSKEAVLVEAVLSGMLQSEAETLLAELIRNGSVREEGGYILL